MRALVNKTKTILSSATVVFFGGYGIFYLVQAAWLPAAVFLAIAALFAFVLVRYASVVHIDDEKVRLTFLGLPRRELAWADIREMGLIGENVFSRGKKKKTGDKYIYFSPEKLTADERFDMIVKWPPSNKIYAEYSERLLEYAMTIWGKELEAYNVEDLYANTAEPRGAKK